MMSKTDTTMIEEQGNNQQDLELSRTETGVSEKVQNTMGTTRRRLVMLSLCLAQFLAAIDITIVATALPTIASSLHATSAQYTWVGSAYNLASTASTPLWAKLSDVVGRKTALLAANTLFLAGSLLAALANSILILIGGRCLQGIGGGGLMILNTIIISDIFPLEDRAKYYGLSAIVWAIASALGPMLGGVFTSTIGWRWCCKVLSPTNMTAQANQSFDSLHQSATRRHFTRPRRSLPQTQHQESSSQRDLERARLDWLLLDRRRSHSVPSWTGKWCQPSTFMDIRLHSVHNHLRRLPPCSIHDLGMEIRQGPPDSHTGVCLTYQPSSTYHSLLSQLRLHCVRLLPGLVLPSGSRTLAHHLGCTAFRFDSTIVSMHYGHWNVHRQDWQGQTRYMVWMLLYDTRHGIVHQLWVKACHLEDHLVPNHCWYRSRSPVSGSHDCASKRSQAERCRSRQLCFYLPSQSHYFPLHCYWRCSLAERSWV